jgi:hypothetical protein
MKIAVIGSQFYENTSKIKNFLFSIKTKSKDINNIVVAGGGRPNGADKYIRKFSIEFGLDYVEYGTTKSMYSVIPRNLFSENRNILTNKLCNRLMVEQCNKIVVFINDDTVEEELNDIISLAKTKRKKVIIIN